MSEDSIASDSIISCRSEVNAPLLPPRKRLLAGLKQNGWPSPSSSSCAVASNDSSQTKETLAQAFATKTEDLDQSSGDAADGGSLQSLNGAAESLDSDTIGERKPKQQRSPSPSTVSKFSKKKKKKSASPNSNEHLLDGAVAAAKASMVADKVKQHVSSKISLDVEEVTVGWIEGKVLAEEKEERATTANGEASAGHAMDLKLGSHHGSIYKEYEEATCEEARKQSRNPARKTKTDIKQVVKTDNTKERRKRSLRLKQSKEKEAGRKKLKMQHEKVAPMPLPLADEELARQLHRAMNSSPRIARCLTPKEEKPLQASSWKRFSSS